MTRREYAKAYYEANKDRIKAAERARYLKDPERKKALARAYHAANKSQISAQNKAWRKANPERCHAHTVWGRYGLSLAEYEALKSAAKVCEICGGSFRSSKAKHLDHDHTTKKTRGVLCEKCNLGIGCLMDDPNTVASALRYLLKHKGASK